MIAQGIIQKRDAFMNVLQEGVYVELLEYLDKETDDVRKLLVGKRGKILRFCSSPNKEGNECAQVAVEGAVVFWRIDAMRRKTDYNSKLGI